ncbi:MAG: diaminopimelate epimerase [Deltaproteobacteria bacterium]|nr:diaminopimelate epimerase [Deltaproteobacteria bacterium]
MTKMHGIGNDYLYVDCRDRDVVADPPRLARAVARRHHGIGSDGLILLRPSEKADCRMEMYNADGSRGEMCGNGIRCVAVYAFDRGLARNPMRIATDDGVKTITVTVGADGRPTGATVDMGVPVLDGPRIPVAHEGRVIDQPLEVAGTTWHVTCVSMGNPHCVVFVPEVASLDLAKIGPRFEHHPFFPRRVNTEFVAVRSRTVLDFRVWERGSGETMACGTGACAALVAGVLTGRTDRRATIHLRGGDLEIEWRAADAPVAGGSVFMTGAAAEVFTADVELDRLYAATGV